MKRYIVIVLEWLCTPAHIITHHRPWIWLPKVGYCPLASISDNLDQRWQTGVWEIMETKV